MNICKKQNSKSFDFLLFPTFLSKIVKGLSDLFVFPSGAIADAYILPASVSYEKIVEGNFVSEQMVTIFGRLRELRQLSKFLSDT